jgi:hydroxyacylglutathione hydrolase
MAETTIRDDWLSAYLVVEDIWRISDNGQDNIYLVLGKNSALVVDTGWGVGNLGDLIRKITPLPLVVVNTHGHIDHALGNDAFDSVSLGADDAKRLDRDGVAEKRAWARGIKLLTAVKETPKFTLWGTHAAKRDVPIQDGMEIDLGGRVITAFLTPGHTPGSACFLDKRSRVLLAGDSFVPSDAWGPMWFHLGESVSLSGFLSKMGELAAGGGFDTMLSGHGECGLMPISRLNALLVGTRNIIDGKIRGAPERTFAGDGLKADFDGVSLVYDPGKL